MPEFRFFFEIDDDAQPFNIWQQSHIYQPQWAGSEIERQRAEVRCDDYIVLNAEYGLKLRDSKGTLSGGNFKFKRLELKARTRVYENGAESWEKCEYGSKPPPLSTKPALDEYILRSLGNAPCCRVIAPPLQYVRVSKQRRACIVHFASVEQTDFSLDNTICDCKEEAKADSSSAVASTSSSASSASSTSSPTSSTSAASSTSSTSSAIVATASTPSSLAADSVSASASVVAATGPSKPAPSFANRRFRSIAFERNFDAQAALKVLETVRSGCRHEVFVGGYPGFLAHLYGLPPEPGKCGGEQGQTCSSM